MTNAKDTPMNTDTCTAAQAGRQIATLVRGAQSGRNVEAAAVFEVLDRMLEGKASTASDALALLTTARTMLFGHPQRRLPSEGTMEPEHELILKLLDRSVEALEKVAGERESIYSGFGPVLN